MQYYYSEKKTKNKKLEYTQKKNSLHKKTKNKKLEYTQKKSFIVFIKYE